ncbi:DUF1326 domain-containing protein [Dongia deserti]|uniref:DUF1326 domain-containing protein n=1 Tax=Dongia deserti TaxID=2268030 RepID=UPI000E646182|nr:DUF1326 domain-containing protein [Dongia deserti]
MTWDVKGTYAEICTCEGACPCIYLQPPTGGSCTALVAWRIEEGGDGETDLRGLNVALALYSPGSMSEGNWRVALYIDKKADDKQYEALTRIFSGSAGGHPANLAPLIGEVAGVERAPIQFEGNKGRYEITVGSMAEAAFSAIEGQNGGPVTVSGHPLAVAPGFPATVARSQRLKLNAAGINAEVSGRTAFYSPFAYAD